MKLWILSDLHLRDRGENFRIPKADVCVCAGDVGEGLGQTIRWLSERIGRHMPVVLVAGNHEFYGSSVPAEFYAARQVFEAGGGEGVHLLEDESIVVGDIRFIGSTLWTDYRLNATAQDRDVREREVAWAMTAADKMVMDHACIRFGDGAVKRRWTPSDAARAHARSRAFIEAELAVPFNGATVVVTHHAPHPGAVSPQFAGSSLNPAFVSDLSTVIEAGRPEAWVFGHVHSSCDYVVADTRLLCNPRGYVQGGVTENARFDRRLVVDVEARHDPVPAVDPVWLDVHAEDVAVKVAARFGASEHRVVGHAPVLWSGWECDHSAAVVELPDGRRELVVLGETARGGSVDLRERITAYREATSATLALVRLLEESRQKGDSS